MRKTPRTPRDPESHEPKPREHGYGPYPYWEKPTREESARRWRTWGVIFGVLYAIGWLSDHLG